MHKRHAPRTQSGDVMSHVGSEKIFSPASDATMARRESSHLGGAGVGAGVAEIVDTGAGVDASVDIGAGVDASVDVGTGVDASSDVGAGVDASVDVGAGADVEAPLTPLHARYAAN